MAHGEGDVWAGSGGQASQHDKIPFFLFLFNRQQVQILHTDNLAILIGSFIPPLHAGARQAVSMWRRLRWETPSVDGSGDGNSTVRGCMKSQETRFKPLILSGPHARRPREYAAWDAGQGIHSAITTPAPASCVGRREDKATAIGPLT